jgi:hypothetical protein
MTGMGDRIALLAAGLTTIAFASPGVGAIVTIFLSSLAIAFGPIALAGASWDAVKGWITN